MCSIFYGKPLHEIILTMSNILLFYRDSSLRPRFSPSPSPTVLNYQTLLYLWIGHVTCFVRLIIHSGMLIFLWRRWWIKLRRVKHARCLFRAFNCSIISDITRCNGAESEKLCIVLLFKVIQMVKAKAGMRLDAEGFALFQIVKERGND